MDLRWLFMLIFTIPWTVANSIQQCGLRRIPDAVRPSVVLKGIVGGETVTDRNKWPWQAALVLARNNHIQCGGSVIGKRWILTAAHCFMEPPKASYNPLLPRTWLIGVNIVASDELSPKRFTGPQVIAIRKINRYEDSDSNYPNDIALLELEEDIANARPICLTVNDTEYIANGTQAHVTGFGWTEKLQFSTTLQEAVVPIVTGAQCDRQKRNDPVSSEKFLCGGGVGNVDSCIGDSGGPIVVHDMKSDRFVQVGIVSRGKDRSCGMKDKYGLYTRVAAYCSFIKKTTLGEVQCGS